MAKLPVLLVSALLLAALLAGWKWCGAPDPVVANIIWGE